MQIWDFIDPDDKETVEKLMKPFYFSKTARAFISYSSYDKILAGKIKQNLENYGIEVFLAHEDIKPSTEWQEEIIRNLKSSDIFLPLLTSNFNQSEWTDQESGMAFIQNLIIIPLKIDVIPYGFIGKYQALKLDLNSTKQGHPPQSPFDKCCKEIIEALLKKPTLEETIKDCIISSFVKSYSFDDANEKALLLSTIDKFNQNQINEIIRAALTNDQIRHGYDSEPFVEKIFSKYQQIIISEFKELLKKVYKIEL